METPLKKEILFIDFEAITPNLFDKYTDYLVKEEIIYCFTIGKVINKAHFVKKTYFVDLKAFDFKVYQTLLKATLYQAIFDFVGKEVEINSDNITLYGWSPVLETKITSRYLKIPTQSLNDKSVSLDDVYNYMESGEVDIFEPIRDLKINTKHNFNLKTVQKTGLLASYLGFVIFMYQNNFPPVKNSITYDEYLLICDTLTKYNSLDVEKMFYILKNIKEATKAIEHLTEINAKILQISSQISKHHNFLTIIKSNLGLKKPDIFINKYLENLEQENFKFQTKIEKSNQEDEVLIRNLKRNIKQNEYLIKRFKADSNCKTVKNVITKYSKYINTLEKSKNQLREQKKLGNSTKMKRKVPNNIK
ncbi:hypothetical protein [Mycoplasma buteonis]|uniref:hypothetical protein n=1 Tax=Mycoplasma buteonis TaxID=171280 RepID=UPI00056CC135|nr:hypothetical protein [Mycoplasma buteonis]